MPNIDSIFGLWFFERLLFFSFDEFINKKQSFSPPKRSFVGFMKVAIVLNTSWNIYNFRMNFVKTLLEKGYEVHTIAPLDPYTKYLTDAGCHHHAVKMDSRGINPIKDFALILELFSIYRAIRPDIILHYTIKPNVYGAIAAAMLKIPTVNNVCGLGTVFLRKNLLSTIAITLYRWSFCCGLIAWLRH